MVPGKDYSLRVNGTSVNLYRNNTGITYPYTVGSLISVTRSSAGAAYYYYFYNWQVQADPCISNRIAVTGTITPCTTGIAANGSDNESINIYPNPAQNTLVIEKNGAAGGTLVVELFNLIGEKVYSSNIENSTGTFKKTLNIEDVPAGIYFVYLNSADKHWIYKLVKQ